VIHWLLQSLDDCPEILRSDATPAWLSPAEQQRTFKAEKRRRDWLLGRWTAKNLVQRYLAQSTGATPALDAIYIGADADGAPYASCEGRGARGEGRLLVSLSISHSHGMAFCGLVALESPLATRPSLGCDLELIEPREGNFLDNFFTAAEVAAVQAVRAVREREAAQGDILTTAIWSGKEAVLKALREGLRIDTRRITCRFDEFAAAPQNWTPFAVIVDEGLAAHFPGKWSGWWRIKDRFALTMALLQETEL
jgi:4'-phosphopantetheinyl transferase